jgi:hypothetical protein
VNRRFLALALGLTISGNGLTVAGVATHELEFYVFAAFYFIAALLAIDHARRIKR